MQTVLNSVAYRRMMMILWKCWIPQHFWTISQAELKIPRTRENHRHKLQFHSIKSDVMIMLLTSNSQI